MVFVSSRASVVFAAMIKGLNTDIVAILDNIAVIEAR